MYQIRIMYTAQWDLKSGIHPTKSDNLLDANGKKNELQITT